MAIVVTRRNSLRRRLYSVASSAGVNELDVTPWTLPGMVFWAEASLETAYVDDDLVATITDRTANANHATAAGANRSTYKTGVLNGLATYRFLGDDVHLTAAMTLRYPVLFIVFRNSVVARLVVEHDFDAGGGTSHFWLYTQGPGQMLRHSKVEIGGGDVFRGPTAAESFMDDNIFRNVRTISSRGGRGLHVYFNNRHISTVDDSIMGDPGVGDMTGPLSIGARNDGTLPITGDIAALGMADGRLLSQLNMILISRYLSTRYAIPDVLP